MKTTGDEIFAHSPRVVLRRMQVSDLAAFQAYRRDPDVARFQDWAAMSDTEAAGFLSAMSDADIPKPGGWCQIAIDVQGNLVGDLGLHISSDETEAELGITLSKSAQGRSVGFEAVQLACDWIFETTKVAKIVAITDARNLPAQSLLQRLGWPFVATLGPEVEILGLTERVYEFMRPQ